MTANPRRENPRPCAPRARCHRWRICPTCAAIRQSQVADLAERLANACGPLELTVLHPAAKGAKAVAALRDAWHRRAKPRGAVWTIEQGSAPGALHLNILHAAGAAAHAGQSSTYREPIRTDPRAVAAYISKPSGYPDPDLYPGRILGRSGPIWQWLIADDSPAIVRGATVQTIITPTAHRAIAPPQPATIYRAPEPTPEQARAAAARWLPALQNLLAAKTDHPTPPPATPPTALAAPHPYERRDRAPYQPAYPNDSAAPPPKTTAEAARTSRPHLDRLRAVLSGAL